MWTFVISGALYLFGVGLVLMIKPAYMFTPDGNWKEFGIGQDCKRYTPFPFWMFCLLWALVCYLIVLCVESYMLENSTDEMVNEVYSKKSNKKNNRKNQIVESDLQFDDEMDDYDGGRTLPKGYYVLNKKASRLAGAPKYVFISQEEL
jgi:hypothetical protein